MKKVFLLDEVDCPNCAAKLEKAVAKEKGVISANINYIAQKLYVEIEEELESTIEGTIKRIFEKLEPDCEVTME